MQNNINEDQVPFEAEQFAQMAAHWLESIHLFSPREVEVGLINMRDGYLESVNADDRDERSMALMSLRYFTDFITVLLQTDPAVINYYINNATVKFPISKKKVAMEAMYRNNQNVVSNEGIVVDEGALWKWDPVHKVLVLEDDDQYVTLEYKKELFKPAH